MGFSPVKDVGLIQSILKFQFLVIIDYFLGKIRGGLYGGQKCFFSCIIFGTICLYSIQPIST